MALVVDVCISKFSETTLFCFVFIKRLSCPAPRVIMPQQYMCTYVAAVEKNVNKQCKTMLWGLIKIPFLAFHRRKAILTEI